MEDSASRDTVVGEKGLVASFWYNPAEYSIIHQKMEDHAYI